MVNQVVVNAGTRYVTGMQVAYEATNQLSVSAGAVREQTNVNDIVATAAFNVYTNRQGLNGLDIGTIAASTSYTLFAVSNSYDKSVFGAVLSTGVDAPNALPEGCDMYWPIAHNIETDGSANLLNFVRVGNGHIRTHLFDAPIAVVTAGAATSFTAVDCGDIVPANCKALLLVSFTPNSAGNAVRFRYKGFAAANGETGVSGSVAAVAVTQNSYIIVDADSNFEYKVSNASDAATVSVIGFEDVL